MRRHSKVLSSSPRSTLRIPCRNVSTAGGIKLEVDMREMRTSLERADSLALVCVVWEAISEERKSRKSRTNTYRDGEGR